MFRKPKIDVQRKISQPKMFVNPRAAMKMPQNEAKRYERAEKAAVEIARNLVLTAGPLDVLEAQVKANPAVLLSRIKVDMEIDGIKHTFEGTLEQLAINNLDCAIKSENPARLAKGDKGDKGMAEELRRLRNILLPETVQFAVDQARLAAPTEKEEEVKDRVAAQAKVLNDVFNLIKRNESDYARAIMQSYIEGKKPAVIKDNRYFLNVLQLMPMAFELLLKRSAELKDGWWGEQIDQYCFASAGVIARALPYMLRRVLTNSFCDLLRGDGRIQRAADVSDGAFIGSRGSASELGVNCFYNGTGVAHSSGVGRGIAFRFRYAACEDFRLYINNYINAVKLMQRSDVQLHVPDTRDGLPAAAAVVRR